MITVFTPAYNRLYTIGRLYGSLCRQTDKDFEWLVVDDGSTDGTEQYFQELCGAPFPVRYYKKENGGKHRAINYGVPLARGEWFFIVDSDDFLTDDAIAVISEQTEKVKDNPDFCAVVCNKTYPDRKVVGTCNPYDVLDTDFLSYRTRYKIKGDRAEVFRISVMKEFPFPEFEGEKFCTEALVWNRMAQKYKARYVNKDVYVCEYLPDGLSAAAASGTVHKNSPQGSALYFLERSTYCGIGLRNRIASYYNYWRFYRLCRMPSPVIRPTWRMRWLGWPVYVLCAVIKRG